MSSTTMSSTTMSATTMPTTSTTKTSGVVTRSKRQRDTKEETTQNKQNKKTIEDLPTTSLGEKLGNVSSKQFSQCAYFNGNLCDSIPPGSRTVEKPSAGSLLSDSGNSETVEKPSTPSLLGGLFDSIPPGSRTVEKPSARSLLGDSGNSETLEKPSTGGLFDSIPPGSRTYSNSMFGGGNIQKVDYTTESIKNYVNKLTGIIDVVEKTKLNINLEFNVVTTSVLFCSSTYLPHEETIKNIILRVEYYIKNLKDITCAHKQYVIPKQVQRTASNSYMTCLTIYL